MKVPVQKLVLQFLSASEFDPTTSEGLVEKDFGKLMTKWLKKFKEEDKDNVRPAAFEYYFKKICSGEIQLLSAAQMKAQQEREEAMSITENDLPDPIAYRTGQKNSKFPKDIFIPLKSGRPVDRLFSKMPNGDCGLMKGTVIVITAGPGVGKSTITYDLISSLQNNYADMEMGCLQGEMSELDLEFEQLTKKWMSRVNFLLTSEQKQEHIKAYISKVFHHGYDVLAIDSFQVIVDLLKAWADMSEGEAETFLIGLIYDTINGKNKRGVFTSVIAIQQVTKGGIFKGSNKLKHAITGMFHLEIDKKSNKRYIVGSKNRRNGEDILKPMYITLDPETKEPVYDIAQFEQDEKDAQFINAQHDKNVSGGAFISIFGNNRMEETETEEVEFLNEQ